MLLHMHDAGQIVTGKHFGNTIFKVSALQKSPLMH